MEPGTREDLGLSEQTWTDLDLNFDEIHTLFSTQ